MHVLFVCHEYPPTVAGGLGAAVATLARGLVRRGHTVSVVGFYDQPGTECDAGVDVFRFPHLSTRWPYHWWRERLHLRRLIARIHRRTAVDVVEWPDYEGWSWKPTPGIVDVVRIHGTYYSHVLHGFAPPHPLLQDLELRHLRRIPHWIGVSQWFLDEWRQVARVTPRSEAVVYNPVDLKLFYPEQGARHAGLVLYVGALRRRKGVESLARAARIFLRECETARLVCIGYENDLTWQHVHGLTGFSERASMIPFAPQTEVARWMRRANVYAMPSFYESCGNGWLEAQAAGVPVVGSRLSCGPEVVRDGETGLLADPHSAEDVAEKVLTLLRNSDLAQRVGEKGVEAAKGRFAVDVAVRQTEAFYSACLSAR